VGFGTRVYGTEYYAWMWEDGVMTDLSDYLDASTDFTRLVYAFDINNRGQIVGVGIRNGEYWGYVLCLPCCPLGTATISTLGRIGKAGEHGAAVDPDDKDGDGLLDKWENCGIDGDGDGTIDYHLHNASAGVQDIYLELDAMTGFSLQPDALTDVVAAFQNAPVVNYYPSTGIQLHIVGEDSGNICDPCIDEDDLPAAEWDAGAGAGNYLTYKAVHFGTLSERNDPGWQAIKLAKSKVFRYGISGDKRTGHPIDGGSAEPGGNDLVLNLGTSSQFALRVHQGASLMHELGHTLGLHHGGADAINYKPNYFSVMNYTWNFKPNPNSGSTMADKALNLYSQSWRLDYSRSKPPFDLHESSLNEYAGIGGDPNVWVPIGDVGNNGLPRIVPMGGPWDFDGDHVINVFSNPVDLNHINSTDPPSPGETLIGHDDWSNLDYLPNNSHWLDGVVKDDEVEYITCESPEGLAYLNELRFDCNGNGIFDDVDIDSLGAPDENDNGVPDECEALREAVGVGDPPETENPSVSFYILTATSDRYLFRTSLPRGSEASFVIFNVKGERVSELHTRLPAGESETTWTARDHANRRLVRGIYFVQLRLQYGFRAEKLVVK